VWLSFLGFGEGEGGHGEGIVCVDAVSYRCVSHDTGVNVVTGWEEWGLDGDACVGQD